MRFKESFIAIIIFVITAIIFSLPLVLHLNDSIPAGSEPPTVSLFQLFSAEWTKEVFENSKSYWDAPIFYPHKHAFAWSEPQLFSSTLIWLFAKIIGMTAAYNILILTYIILSGFIGYLFALELTNDKIAAYFIGIWLTAGSYVIQQFGVLHLIATPFPFACIYFLILFAKEMSVKRLTGVVVMYILTWFTCAQFGMFLTILIPFALLPFIFPMKWSKKLTKYLIFITIGIIVIAISILPYLLTQHNYLEEMGFERSLSDVLGNFQWHNFISPAKGHWLATHIRHLDHNPNMYSWSIGVVMLIILLIASITGFLKQFFSEGHRKKILWSLFILSVVSLIIGFGPELSITIGEKKYGPYIFLYNIIPGLDGIRSPARFGAFLTFGVAIMTAPALAFLRRKFIKMQRAITVILFILLFAEMWTMPISLASTKNDINKHISATNWLKNNQNDFPLLELPMSLGARPAYLEPEVHAMRRALIHQHHIINGYSGNFPVSFEQLKFALNNEPQEKGIRYIQAMKPHFILYHKNTPASSYFYKTLELMNLPKVYEDEEDIIFYLKYIAGSLKEQNVIPKEAKFRIMPKVNDIVRIPLSKPINYAILLLGENIGTMQFKWPDVFGNWIIKDFIIRGSVILDKDQSRLYLKILEFPANNKKGFAKLVAAEELGQL